MMRNDTPPLTRKDQNMRASEFLSENYIAKEHLELGKRYALTVTTIDAVQLDSVRKPAVSFRETTRRLLLHKCNLRRAVEALGEDDMALWSDCRLVIFHDPDVEFGGRRVGGVRVDSAATREANKPAAAPATALPSGAPHDASEARL